MKMSAITFDKSIMAGIMEDAIAFCAEKTELNDREQVLEAIRCGDCSVCEYLRYGLAKEIAAYLGSVDGTVKAVYVFEPEYATNADRPIPDRPNLAPAINLIAWVSRKSAALSSIVASVGSALAEEHKRLACPKANGMCYRLDVKVADDDEVKGRVGYGALIHSLYVRPIEIWQR
jgi:hypothetical protein